MSPDTFVSIINQSLPEPHASLLAGMIFGAKYSKLPEELYSALIRTGTLHVVALSGTNVTILVRLVEKLTIAASRKKAFLLTIGLICGFVLLVGFDPPIVRAAIMGGIAAVGDFAGKRKYGILSLLFAAGLMLLIWPEWLFSLSFQLSFLATLGIILFDFKEGKKTIETEKIGVIREIYIKAGRTFTENLRTTLAAQIFITPLLIYNFGRLSLIAPLSNALSLWSVEFITVAGIAVSLGGLVWAPAGRVIGWVSWVFLEYFILVVNLTNKAPFGEIRF